MIQISWYVPVCLWCRSHCRSQPDLRYYCCWEWFGHEAGAKMMQNLLLHTVLCRNALNQFSSCIWEGRTYYLCDECKNPIHMQSVTIKTNCILPELQLSPFHFPSKKWWTKIWIKKKISIGLWFYISPFLPLILGKDNKILRECLARSWIILTEKSSEVLKLKVELPQKKKNCRYFALLLLVLYRPKP